MNSKEKSKFRNTKSWKVFRQRLKQERKIDAITLKPLSKLYNLHHLIETSDEEVYTDLSDETKFACLNPQTHNTIEFLYSHAVKDKEFMSRVNNMIEEMLKLSQNS